MRIKINDTLSWKIVLKNNTFFKEKKIDFIYLMRNTLFFDNLITKEKTVMSCFQKIY